MKKCHKCGAKKSLGLFPKNKSKTDGRSETCLECKREYNRLHYKNNKKYYVDKAQVYKDFIREEVQKFKSELGCKICSEKHPACLHFHHRDPEQKLFEVCDAVRRSVCWSDLLEEIKKCDVLCSNCHAKLHFEMSGKVLPSECDGSTLSSEERSSRFDSCRGHCNVQ